MALVSVARKPTSMRQTAFGAWSRQSSVRTLASVGSSQPSSSPLPRRALLGAGLATAAALIAMPDMAGAAAPATSDKVDLSDTEWQKKLSPEAYSVLRRAGTERRWTSPYNTEKRAGTFNCAGCGSALFASSTKFESGTGWPSFYAPVQGAVSELPDLSIPFMPRVEVRCARCKGHLGHVFDDGPKPSGLRYCMNGVALSFQPSTTA